MDVQPGHTVYMSMHIIIVYELLGLHMCLLGKTWTGLKTTVSHQK